MNKKVVIVQNVLAPYRNELFNRLSGMENCDLKVLYLYSNLKNQQWKMDEAASDAKFNYTLIEPRTINIRGRKYHLGIKLYNYLKSCKPDLIISGELGINTFTSLVYSKRHRIPLVVWWAGSGQTEKDISRVKGAFRQLLVKRIDRFIVYSNAAAEYLIHLGVRSDDINVAGNFTFNACEYRARVDREKSEALEWRRKAGIDESSLVLLSVGGLLPMKNQEQLLDIVAAMPPSLRQSIRVLFVGDGPARHHLESKALQSGICVHFLGHVEPASLFLFYAIADIFVHLTLKDRWSQAVNEAMASGLPVVVSKYDHAVELIRSGENGFAVNPEERDEINRIMMDLANSPQLREKLGRAAFSTVATDDVSKAMRVFQDVIEECITSIKAPPSTEIQK